MPGFDLSPSWSNLVVVGPRSRAKLYMYRRLWFYGIVHVSPMFSANVTDLDFHVMCFYSILNLCCGSAEYFMNSWLRSERIGRSLSLVLTLEIFCCSWNCLVSGVRYVIKCYLTCFWIPDQTIEELPLEFESASRPASSFDATGLPPPATKGSNMAPALHALINGDYAGVHSTLGYLGSPRGSKSKRNFLPEHSINGGMVSNHSWSFWRVGESSHCRDTSRCA